MGTSSQSQPCSGCSQSCVLEGIPCAALLFDADGRLVAANARAGDLRHGLDAASCTFEALGPRVELVGGAKLSAAELMQRVLRDTSCVQYHQYGNGTGPPRWLLCQASAVQQPATGVQLMMLLQLDVTESQQRFTALEASADRMQEQMQALQRKLLHTVTENEAHTHVVEQLQCHVLSMRRQLQAAGLRPELPLDEKLLRPNAFEAYMPALAGCGDASPTCFDEAADEFGGGGHSSSSRHAGARHSAGHAAAGAHSRFKSSQAARTALERKASYDKLAADAAEYKAGYDKLLVDGAEQQAQLNKATADAAEYKAGYDKLLVDGAEQQAQLNKAAADAAEFKAGYDKLLVDGAEQQAQLSKVTADAAELKAGYDKLEADAVVQHAQLDKATADAVQYKAGFDKLVADSVEHKAQLDKATADAAEYKAGYDKLLVDGAEQQAQLNKAAADAAEYKAGYDKLLVDGAEQQAQLNKVAADAAEYKAGYDKLLVDGAEHQAQLCKATADAAEFKAGYDKLLVDGAEQQAQLNKVAADAAEYKAGYDKLLVDGAEHQAQLCKATADAAEFKAGYDKLLVDGAEQQAQLSKVTADAAELKAGFDKMVVDSVEHKAQLDKVTADAAEYKAGLDKVTADAAEYKAGYDKATADAMELKAGYDKYAADATEMKNQADDAVAQMTKMAVDMSQVQEQLVRERENYSVLHDQHMQLRRQQEVLAAELMVALGSYKPKANIDAGTPADKLLQMLTDLLDGTLPNLQDILLIQSSILEARDIYQPWRLGKQLLETKDLEDQVGMCLVHLLGDTETLQQTRAAPEPVTLQQLCDRKKRSTSVSPASSVSDLVLAAGMDLPAVLQQIVSARRSRDVCATPRKARDGEGGGTASEASPERQQAQKEQQQLKEQQLPPRTGRRPSAFSSSDSSSTAAAARMRAASGGSGGGMTGRRAAQLLHNAAGGGISSLESSTSSSGSARGNTASDDEADADAADYASELTLTSSTQLASPTLSIPLDKLEAQLALAYEWQFDAFALAEASGGHPLSTLAYYLFAKQGLLEHFGLRPAALARFLRRMEAGYRANPYHNAMHAADVLQTLHCIVTRGGLQPGYVDPLHLMACYTAAVVHDFEHGGLTNDFLVNSLDRLAVRYNDRSPLENHHLAAAFTIMQQPDYHFLAGLPRSEFERFRKVVIELVLATDMKQHFSILSHFTTVHRLNAGGVLTPGTSTGDPRAMRQHNRSETSGSTACSVDQEQIVLPLDENERVLGLQMALKCADIGHVTAALPVHIRWVQQLEEEFFRQGDVERESGMTVSPLFDRSKQGITKSQVGFFEIVVIPLFHTFSKVFGSSKPLLTYVMRNYGYWSDQTAASASASASASGAAAASKTA